MSIAADHTIHPPLRIGVVGAGHWGSDLCRAFAVSSDWELVAICDTERLRAEGLALQTGAPAVVASVDELLEQDIDAVAIATPAHTHHEITLQAIAAGKHVLAEKPLGGTTERGTKVVRAAREAGLVLMAEHTACYTPAATKIREIVAAGELGDIVYVDSVHINMRSGQAEGDVFWELASQDLPILDFILPGGVEPVSVSAQGTDPLRAGKACVGYLSLPLTGGALAHLHVNWLSPTRIRQMVIGGSRKTLIWDALNPQQQLSVIDRGSAPDSQGFASLPAAGHRADASSHRLDESWSPALSKDKPLELMVSLFAAAIRGEEGAPTDGRSALRVLSVLEAATASLARGGAKTAISTVASETASVDAVPDASNVGPASLRREDSPVRSGLVPVTADEADQGWPTRSRPGRASDLEMTRVG